MNSNFEYYRVFYYVSKYENLTKAAAALKTSQPAVTRTIQNLENELGCRLFTRSKTGVKLTPEGSTFYEYIAAGCSQFFRGEENLSNMISLENGTIYLSATETAQHCCLFPAMEEFNRHYPSVHFKVLNNSTRESIQAVREGRVDLAIVSSSSTSLVKPLKATRISSYQDILIGGTRFAEYQGRDVSLEELSECPWISLTSDSITRNFMNHYFSDHELNFTPDIELATTDMILLAVRHNLGLGFIPAEFAASDLKLGTVVQIHTTEEMPLRNIMLIRDMDSPQSIAARDFVKFLLKRKK